MFKHILVYLLNLILLAVEALKVTRIRTGLCTQSHCYGQGGGALGTRMNLFDRFARVVKVRSWIVYLHLRTDTVVFVNDHHC